MVTKNVHPPSLTLLYLGGKIVHLALRVFLLCCGYRKCTPYLLSLLYLGGKIVHLALRVKGKVNKSYNIEFMTL